jgi:hypothetical protein
MTEVKYLGILGVVAVACLYAGFKIQEERKAEYKQYEKELAEAKAKQSIVLTPEQFDTLKMATRKVRSGITPPPPGSEEILKNIGTFLLGFAAEKGLSMVLEGFFEKQQVDSSAKKAVAAALGTFDTVRTFKDIGDIPSAIALLKKTLAELDQVKGSLPSPAKCLVSFQCFEIARALGASLQELNIRGFETFKALAESTVLTKSFNRDLLFFTEEEGSTYQVYPFKQINLNYRGLLNEGEGFENHLRRVPKELQSVIKGEVLAAGISAKHKSENNLAAFTNKYLIRRPITSVHWSEEFKNPIAQGLFSIVYHTGVLLTSNIAEAMGQTLKKYIHFAREAEAENHQSIEYLLTKALYEINGKVLSPSMVGVADNDTLFFAHAVVTFDDTELIAKGYANLLNVPATKIV